MTTHYEWDQWSDEAKFTYVLDLEDRLSAIQKHKDMVAEYPFVSDLKHFVAGHVDRSVVVWLDGNRVESDTTEVYASWQPKTPTKGFVWLVRRDEKDNIVSNNGDVATEQREGVVEWDYLPET